MATSVRSARVLVILSHRGSSGSCEHGFAVVAVLLLLIGLMGLAHGALLLAGRELTASRLEARLLSRRLAARGATHLPPLPDTLPSLDGFPRLLFQGARGPLRWKADGVALGAEIALVSGVAKLEGVPGEDRIGVLVWMLGPSERVAAASAVVETGTGADLAGGDVRAADWLTPRSPEEAAACTGELRALDSLGAQAPPPLASLPLEEIYFQSGASPPRLGLLPGDTLMSRVPLTAGVVNPTPLVWAGTCVPEASNWGSPSDPTGPCGTRMAVVASEGDLVVSGGEGQGVLVVRGSLRLTGGARFEGVVLVGSDLLVERGAVLRGMARVRGALRLRDSGQVDGSACAAARALRAATPLRLPLLLPGWARIHPL